MAAWQAAIPSWISSWKVTRAVAAASGTSSARCRRRWCRVTWTWPPACTRTAASTSPSSSSPPSCRCRLPRDTTPPGCSCLPATSRGLRGSTSSSRRGPTPPTSTRKRATSQPRGAVGGGAETCRAARNFDAAGDGDQALALYEQIGDQESRADCLLRSGRAFEAADLYVELGNVRGEVDALRKVPETDPLRVDAVKRLAAILARRNRLAEATQLAADALRENDAAKKDLGLHELLVDLLVRQGLHDQAERVRTRMQRIAARERVGAAVAPPPSASGPAPAAPEDYGFLKAIPLFGKLPLQDMKDLYRLSAEVTYKPGAIVVEEGVDAPGLIVIVEGSAEVVAIGAGGARHLNSLGPGDHLGEISLVSKSVTSARVVASSLVRALKISPDRFAGFVYSHPAGAAGIYRLFSEKLAERVRALSTPEGG